MPHNIPLVNPWWDAVIYFSIAYENTSSLVRLPSCYILSPELPLLSSCPVAPQRTPHLPPVPGISPI